MTSIEHEEDLPAYQATAPATSSQYRPPPGPPPPLAPSTAPNDITPLSNTQPNAPLQPPSLGSAPPVYEPFSFATAYSRAHLSNAPRWHSPPSYHVYHDRNSATLSIHIALPATEAPCACSNDFTCTCGRRRPAIWQASTSHANKSNSKLSIELQRISPFSESRQLAFSAANEALLGSSSSTLTIRDAHGKSITQIKRKVDAWSYKDLQGSQVAWRKLPGRLELSDTQGLPMAILHSGAPARLELTSFAWSRMPSDQIECDFPACSLRPLYGFVFRCRDCTEEGEDSFDICEPHLFTECRDHNQSHRFVRQPRPFAEFDDGIQETPLLKEKDMQEERRNHELVVMTLACALLDSR